MKHHYRFAIHPSSLFLIIISFILASCRPSSSNALPLIFCSDCSSTHISGLEQEHVVIMKSTYNDAIKETLAVDVGTRVNASYLDIETGLISNTVNTSEDIYFLVDCGSMCSNIIEPMEKAKVSYFNTFKPAKQQCIDQLKNQETGGALIPDVPGYYSCVQTSEGRIGWIRYDHNHFSNGIDPAEIQLTYCLWDGIVPKN